MRSDRLLRGMHKVYSHDLPNQLVALQSLLQMLELEELERLGKDGQEYVQRLQKVARRTGEMVRFLKEMGKLQAYASKPEAIALSMLAREIQGTLKQQFPRRPFAFAWQWAVPALVGDYKTFAQALTEILGVAISANAAACRLHAVSELLGNQVGLHFSLENSASGRENDPRFVEGRRTSPSLPPERMEIILAREWLAVSEAMLEMNDPMHGGSRFTILVPNRQA